MEVKHLMYTIPWYLTDVYTLINMKNISPNFLCSLSRSRSLSASYVTNIFP